MRELTNEELDEISGGVLNLWVGLGAAAVGGLGAGASYAINANQTGNFNWREFAYSVGTTAAAGFLIGTGTSLIAAGATGALPGAHVLGVTMTGTGTVIAVTSNVDDPESKGGGS